MTGFSYFAFSWSQVLVHKAMVVLNNLIARVSPAQFGAIMRLDFVDRLVQLVGSRNEGVQEQAIWILDNIALDCGTYREQTMQCGALPAILDASDVANSAFC